MKVIKKTDNIRGLFFFSAIVIFFAGIGEEDELFIRVFYPS